MAGRELAGVGNSVPEAQSITLLGLRMSPRNRSWEGRESPGAPNNAVAPLWLTPTQAPETSGILKKAVSTVSRWGGRAEDSGS